MNINGNTKWQDRVIALTADAAINLEQLHKLSGKIEMDKPNADIDSWRGRLIEIDLKCDVNNLLLRGETLKGTSADTVCYGICIHVGTDCKIMKS